MAEYKSSETQRMKVNSGNTSVNDAIVGAAINTTNGAYSAVLRTLSACHKHMNTSIYTVQQTPLITVYSV